MSLQERIWYEDLNTFIDLDNLIKFIPNNDMSFAEQLNAMMRFAVYFAIIVFIIKHDATIFYFPLFMAAFTFALHSVDKQKEDKKKELFDKLNIDDDKRNKRFCYRPTKENPFMNITMNDYKEFPNRPEACDVTRESVKDEVKRIWDEHIVRDVDDIFQRRTSDRQFYTMPSTTIPNNQTGFAEWLYKPPKTCKEDSIKCYG